MRYVQSDMLNSLCSILYFLFFRHFIGIMHAMRQGLDSESISFVMQNGRIWSAKWARLPTNFVHFVFSYISFRLGLRSLYLQKKHLYT